MFFASYLCDENTTIFVVRSKKEATDLEVGISTACFYPMLTEEAIEKTISLGFKEIEVFFNAESEFDFSFLKKIKSRLDENGVVVKSIHPYTSALEGLLFFSSYQRRTEDAFLQYEKYFQVGQLLGARYFTFHGERNIKTMQPEPEENTIKTYKKICNMAEEKGIIIAQENVAWCKSAELSYLDMLVKNVSKLSFTLDLKQAYRAKKKADAYLDVMGNRLVNVHINDYNKENDCLLPGEGEFDFALFLKQLQKVGYSDSVLLEVYASNYQSEEQLFQSAVYLSQI